MRIRRSRRPSPVPPSSYNQRASRRGQCHPRQRPRARGAVPSRRHRASAAALRRHHGSSPPHRAADSRVPRIHDFCLRGGRGDDEEVHDDFQKLTVGRNSQADQPAWASQLSNHPARSGQTSNLGQPTVLDQPNIPLWVQRYCVGITQSTGAAVLPSGNDNLKRNTNKRALTI